MIAPNQKGGSVRLLLVLSLFISSFAMATSPMRPPRTLGLLASVKVAKRLPGAPVEQLKIYLSGRTDLLRCPIAPVPCSTVKSTMLNKIQHENVLVLSRQTLKGPTEEPAPVHPTCKMVPSVYHTYYVGSGLSLVEVASKSAPCGVYSYKNTQARALVKVLDRLLQEIRR